MNISLLLGIDIGTSSIKVSVVNSQTQHCIASTTYPSNEERAINTPFPGWAEQSPEQWWADVKEAIRIVVTSGKFPIHNIAAIGITYQMHGLVLVDKNQNVLRDAIIWCDSRTQPQAQQAIEKIGAETCLNNLLNLPGNFTASKLAWVKQNEPEVYDKVDKWMLPGDFIAMKMTGNITATISMLSEGAFWDYKRKELSKDVLNCYGFNEHIFPQLKPLFSTHGQLSKSIAEELGLKEGTPVTYKAGDQLNNAFSLNVLQAGEIATTSGTSGVIYAVADQFVHDSLSRINTFAHVNYTNEQNKLGALLCINGAGISNRWTKQILNINSYVEMNKAAASVPIGSDSLLFLPFGNGAERMFCNEQSGAGFFNINFNIHQQAHLCRAVLEGVAFAFRNGLDIMRENGIQTNVVKAGYANMFLSDVFADAFVNTTGLTLEIYATDGSIGAALGAGVGAGIFKNTQEALSGLQHLKTIHPVEKSRQAYETAYQEWKYFLSTQRYKTNAHK